jgi:hypothetical protein
MLVHPRRSAVAVGRRGGAKRRHAWCTAGVQTFLTPAATSHSVDLLANFELAGASTLGCTIVRTHLRIFPDLSATAGEYWQFGLIIGRDTDVGTANPNVNAEPELDWMYDNIVAPFAETDWFEVDLRSKRKMTQMGQRYILNFYNSGAASHTFRWFARTLVALP